MSTVAAWHSAFTSWVSEEGNETVVITTDEELSIGGSSDTVDVSTIGSSGVDTLSAPLEFHSLSCPDNTFGVRSARWILRTIFSSPEEEFISTTVRSEILIVRAPIKSHDVGRVTFACCFESPASGFIDVDSIVV
jgi:hypothetical protein